MKFAGVGALSLFALGAIVVDATAARAAEKISASSLAPGMVSQSKPSKTPLNMKALHRLDFIVKGKSCAVCLMGIQKRLKKTPGVAQVAVMLRKPYAAVCIYDSTKSNPDKLLKIAKGDERQVSFESIEDAPIEKIPTILIPHHSFDKTQ